MKKLNVLCLARGKTDKLMTLKGRLILFIHLPEYWRMAKKIDMIEGMGNNFLFDLMMRYHHISEPSDWLNRLSCQKSHLWVVVTGLSDTEYYYTNCLQIVDKSTFWSVIAKIYTKNRPISSVLLILLLLIHNTVLNYNNNIIIKNDWIVFHNEVILYRYELLLIVFIFCLEIKRKTCHCLHHV